jgi:hypothetical protein
MSRLTGTDAYGLMEAYSAVYTPQELTEEQVWEEVENWVNSLLEEGYDLSEYTWEEMYESYIEEASDLNIGLGRKVLADREAARATKPAPTPTSRPQPQLKDLSIGAGGFNVKNKPVNTGISPIFQRPGTKPVATPATTKPTATRPAAGAPATPAPAAARPSGGAPRPTAPTTSGSGKVSPTKPAASAQTGDKAKDMATFAKANPGLAAAAAERARTRGTSATTNPLMKDMKSRLPAPAALKMEMEYDTFDTILEHLVAEGFADTNESALVIMANMSEEWRQSILDEGDNYDKNRQRAAKRAAERNAARDRGQTGNVPGVGYVTPRRERETYRDSGGVERHTSGARMPSKDKKDN